MMNIFDYKHNEDDQSWKNQLEFQLLILENKNSIKCPDEQDDSKIQFDFAKFFSENVAEEVVFYEEIFSFSLMLQHTIEKIDAAKENDQLWENQEEQNNSPSLNSAVTGNFSPFFPAVEAYAKDYFRKVVIENEENKVQKSFLLDRAEELRLTFPLFFPLTRVQTEEFFQNGLIEKEEKISPINQFKNNSSIIVLPDESINEKLKKQKRESAVRKARKEQQMLELADEIEKLSKRMQFLTEENLKLRMKCLNMSNTTSFEIDTFLPVTSIRLETGIQNSTEQMHASKKTTGAISPIPRKTRDEKRRIYFQNRKENKKKILSAIIAIKASFESEIQRLETENQQLKQQN